MDWKKAGLALTWGHPKSQKLWEYWWQVPWEWYYEDTNFHSQFMA